MKVIQLIDSLEAGGAERVAVNYANELSKVISRSYLCATRKEGILKEDINNEVSYLFLNKKKRIDITAISRFIKHLRSNKIDIIHAHSSSFFLATISKLFYREVKIIWHDHYGNSEFLSKRSIPILKKCAYFFSHIICVNRILKDWLNEKLPNKKTTYIPNFAVTNNNKSITKLEGEAGKRIICLANLRPQKDHVTLLKAFKYVVDIYNDWSLHLVGKDFKDQYYKTIKTQIQKLGLSKNVYLYGSKTDISYILNQCEIGVLSSKSEGLPLAMLEYGIAGLPVVVTDVGECGEVIGNEDFGVLVNPEDSNKLASGIISLIANKSKRDAIASNFYKKIEKEYSSKSIIKKVQKIYNSI